MIENILLRFPVIGQKIFKQLDNQNLTKCKEVCHSWGHFLNDETLVWLRMLQKYDKNHVEFQEDWKKVTTKVPCETLKSLAIATEQFYTFISKRLEFQHSPMHIVSERGILSLCKFIAEKNVVINPSQLLLNNINDNADNEGWTPLHIAARCDHLEIYKCIAEKLENKNPALDNGMTSLHLAAHEGQFGIVDYIIGNVEDKNPADNLGVTPLHEAALQGEFEICKLILENVDNKNPCSLTSRTPLHDAAFNGHLEICKLILKNVDNKNPSNLNGRTPLHDAASNGHLEIYKCIAENLANKNPALNNGKTALHLAAKKGKIKIVEYIVGNVEDKNPVEPGYSNGWTLLHQAALNGDLEVYKCIAEKLEDKNPALNYGMTPLELAIKERKFEIVKYIIANVQDKNSVATPIYQAALKGDFEIFKLFADNVEVRNPGIILGHDFTWLDIFKAIIIGGGDDPNPEIAAGRSAILDLITEMQEGPLPRSNKQKEAENSDGFFKKLMNSIKNFSCFK